MSTALGQPAGKNQVTVGVSITMVYKQLGTPTIEFPYKGKLIQEYEQCTVTSQDGVVVSVVHKSGHEPLEEPISKKPPPSIQDIKSMAEQGDSESQYILAYCFQVGQTVAQDHDDAIRWYTIAAMQGHMPSQHNLGTMYMTGEGIEQNYEQAYVWACLAASNGNDTLIQALANRVTADQKLTGRLRASRILDGLEKPPYPSKESDRLLSQHNRTDAVAGSKLNGL
jgi:hypothetical protein